MSTITAFTKPTWCAPCACVVRVRRAVRVQLVKIKFIFLIGFLRIVPDMPCVRFIVSPAATLRTRVI